MGRRNETMQTQRHFFPGGNTPEGFFSYYHEILKGASPGRLAIIKGGPGCGKSTFMKQLANRMQNEGVSVDYLHCSSDPSSLDGLYLPKYHSAILDGTAPHVVDPRYPGVCDTIFNFCEWIEPSIGAERETIIKENEKIRSFFSEGYGYLKSASCILEKMQQKSRNALSWEEMNRFCTDVLKRLPTGCGSAREKRMFLSAITPEGFKNYLGETFFDRYVMMLRCETGDAAGDVLEQLAAMCRIRNIDIVCYPCPMNPRSIEHLEIPSANFSLTVSNGYHTYENPDQVVYFSDFCRQDYDNNADFSLYRSLLERAVSSFAKAKTAHDRLEQCYIPYVNFEKIDTLFEDALAFLTKTS